MHGSSANKAATIQETTGGEERRGCRTGRSQDGESAWSMLVSNLDWCMPINQSLCRGEQLELDGIDQTKNLMDEIFMGLFIWPWQQRGCRYALIIFLHETGGACPYWWNILKSEQVLQTKIITDSYRILRKQKKRGKRWAPLGTLCKIAYPWLNSGEVASFCVQD